MATDTQDRSPLSDDLIRETTAPPTGDKILWDTGDFVGLGCRIKPASSKHPKGVRTFIVQYRKDGKTLRQKIGRWNGMKVAAARKAAMPYISARATGGDLIGEQRREQAERIERENQERQATEKAAANTLAKLADTYLRQTYGPPEKPTAKSGREMWRIWNTVILPEFGERPVTSITSKEIKTLLRQAQTDAADVERGWNGATTANRTLARLQSFYAWAADDENVDPPIPDATAGIKKRVGERKRGGEAVLEDHELRWIWMAADALPYPVGPFLKLAMLCGQRPDAEIANIRRSQIDAEVKVWKIPPLHYKTVEYFELPFGNLAWEVVEGMEAEVAELERRLAERTGGQTFVPLDHLLINTGKLRGDVPMQDFSGVKAKTDAMIAELQKAARAAGERVKPMRHWTLYYLRHTMKTGMQKLDVDRMVSELCMGHVLPEMERRYGHHPYRDEKRAAFDKWAKHLHSLVPPPPPSSLGDNVVSMPNRSAA